MRNNLVVPRNGVSLQVLIVARISGCASQKDVSIDDQIDNCKAEIKSMVDDNMIVNYETIQSKDKGEALDRKELTQLSDIVATNTIDIVICEDLGRIIRGAEANALAGKMCDHKTRLIAINDDIDTNYENWEEDVLSACRDHVGHNSHTSKRLKKKLMTRFERSGAARADLPYGYLPYSKGDSYYDIKKDPEAEIYIRKGYELLAASLSSSLVAKYFNENKVPTGPYMTRTKWDTRSVLRLYKNPIFKGHPCRGATKSIKHHQTGRRISVKNPEGKKFIDCPHLAYLTEIEFDSLKAAFAQKNRNCAHKKVNGQDPLLGKSRKISKFPGMHATCWYCGSHFIWGCNGQMERLMCSKCKRYECWNSVGFNGQLLTDKICDWLVEVLTSLDQFNPQYEELLAKAREGNTIKDKQDSLKRELNQKLQEENNLIEAISSIGFNDSLNTKYKAVQDKIALLKFELKQLEIIQDQSVDVPASTSELASMIRESLLNLSRNSIEFSVLIRQIVRQIIVYNVRLIDGGRILPRAQVQLDLSGISPTIQQIPGMEHLLCMKKTFDLFKPFQRVAIMTQAVDLTAQGYTQRDACKLIEGIPTQPALQHALKLHQLTLEKNMETPYEIIKKVPSENSRLLKHKNSFYEFLPVPGYIPMPLD